MVRAPADVGSQGYDDTVMGSSRTVSCVTLQRQMVLAHDPQHSLGIDRWLANKPALPIDQCGDPPIAVGRTLVDD
jgi:hypothetical protein